MGDLTHCYGGACPLRNRCYRFRAERYARFDAFGHEPWDAATQRCEHFWDLTALAPTEAQVRDRAYHRWLAAGRPEGTADQDWHAARAELEANLRARLREPDPEPEG